MVNQCKNGSAKIAGKIKCYVGFPEGKSFLAIPKFCQFLSMWSWENDEIRWCRTTQWKFTNWDLVSNHSCPKISETSERQSKIGFKEPLKEFIDLFNLLQFFVSGFHFPLPFNQFTSQFACCCAKKIKNLAVLCSVLITFAFIHLCLKMAQVYPQVRGRMRLEKPLGFPVPWFPSYPDIYPYRGV